MGKLRIHVSMEKINEIRQMCIEKLNDVKFIPSLRKFKSPLHKKLAKIEKIYEIAGPLKRKRLFKMYKATEKTINKQNALLKLA